MFRQDTLVRPDSQTKSVSLMRDGEVRRMTQDKLMISVENVVKLGDQASGKLI